MSQIDDFLNQDTTSIAGNIEQSSNIDRFMDDANDIQKLESSNQLSNPANQQRAAKILSIQGKTGMASDLIDRNLDQIESEMQKKDFNADKFYKESPIVSKWLAEHPNHFNAARVDLNNLNYIERQIKFLGDNFKKTNLQNDLGSIGFDALMGKVTPDQRKQQIELEKQLDTYKDLEKDYDLSGFIEQIPGMTVGQIPNIWETLKGSGVGALGGMLAGNPVIGGMIGGAAAAAKMEASQAYLEFERLKVDGKPLDRNLAVGAAVTTGVINGALEMAGLHMIKARIPGLRSLGRSAIKESLIATTKNSVLLKALKDVGEAALGEGSTEFMQEAVKDISGELAQIYQEDELTRNSKGSVWERLFSQEKIQNWIAAGKGGAQAGLGFAGAGNAIGVRGEIQKARQAEQTAQAMINIGETAKNTKMLETLPKISQDLISNIATNSDGQNIYIPVESWNTYWQSHQDDQGASFDPRQVAEEVMGDAGAYDEAMKTGTPIVVPMKDYATKIAPTDHNKYFAAEVKAQPDAWNLRERLENFKQTQEEVAKLNEEIKGSQIGKQEDIQDPADQALFSDIYNKYSAAIDPNAGITPESLMNNAIADFNRLKVRERIAQTPAVELWKQDNLKIIQTNTPQGGLFQGPKSEQFNNWFQDSKVVDDKGEPMVVYHGSPNDFQVFDTSKIGTLGTTEGKGFYFTNNKTVAEGYQKQGDRNAPAGKLYKVYLSIQNPITDLNQHTISDEQKQEIFQELYNTDPDALSNIGDVGYEGIDSILEQATQMHSSLNDLDFIGSLVNGGISSYENIINAVEKITGLDGAIVKPEWGDGDSKIMIAFKPEQIKSIDNKGTFDPNNPNILFQGERLSQTLTEINEQGFYSELENQILKMNFSKMPVKDLINILKKNQSIKQDELQWSGIIDFLESLPNSFQSEVKNLPDGSINETVEGIAKASEKPVKGAVITKEELLSVLNAKNIQVNEVVLGDTRIGPLSIGDTVYGVFNKSGELVAQYMDGDEAAANIDEDHEGWSVQRMEWDGGTLEDVEVNNQAEAPSQYSKYTLKGDKTGYREILLTLNKKQSHAAQELVNKFHEIESEINQLVYEGEKEWEAEGRTAKHFGTERHIQREKKIDDLKVESDKIQRQIKELRKEKEYEAPHFSGHSNILVHFRIDTRMVEGKKTLFIEEIQSDWHQRGRRVGYITGEEPKPMSLFDKETTLQDGTRVHGVFDRNQPGKLIQFRVLPELAEIDIKRESHTWKWAWERFTGEVGIGIATTEESAREYAKTSIESRIAGQVANDREELARENRSNRDKVPNAPFKNNKWVNLALKRILRIAAEEGHEAIGWTTGYQQSKRYQKAVAENIDEITLVRQHKGETDKDQLYTLNAYKNSVRSFSETDVPASRVADLIGKDAAKNLIEGADTNGTHTIKAGDIKIGDAGMSAFYNTIVPGALKDVIKKSGKVTTAQIELAKVIQPLFSDEAKKRLDEIHAEKEQIRENITKPLIREINADVERQRKEFYKKEKPPELIDLQERRNKAMQAYSDASTADDNYQALSRAVDDLDKEIGAYAFNGMKAQEDHPLWNKYMEGINKIKALNDEALSLKPVQDFYYETEPIHFMELSPELKQKVMGGQALFQVDLKRNEVAQTKFPMPEKVRIGAINDETVYDINAGYDNVTHRKLNNNIVNDHANTIKFRITDKTINKIESEVLKRPEEHPQEKLIVLKHLESVIKDAVYVAKEKDTTKKDRHFLNLFTIQNINGKQFGVKIQADGQNKFEIYNIVLVDAKDVQKAEKNLAGSAAGNTASASPAKSDTMLTPITGNEVTLAEFEKIINRMRKVPYFQEGQNKNYLGAFKQTPDGQMIFMFKDKDLSTLLHERAHSWLFSMAKDYGYVKNLDTHTETQIQFMRDWETLMTSLGSQDFTTLSVDQHEKFAAWMEAYFREGKAPSVQLIPIFNQFKKWLQAIYKTVQDIAKRLGIKEELVLSQDVKDVFDRMFATQEEIDQAHKIQGDQALFLGDASKFGMSEAEAVEYENAVIEARSAAEAELTNKILADYRKKLTNDWREKEKAVREDVANQVNNQREYIALSVLQKGKLPDGTEFKEKVKISKKAFMQAYGKYANQRMQGLPNNIFSAKDGHHQDVVAGLFGYSSGDELLTVITNKEKASDVIERQTQETMAREHGDMMKDGSISEEAIKSIHNDKKAQLLRRELEYLVSDKLAQFKKMVKRISRPLPTIQEVRDQAIAIISNKKIREINPHLYQLAEARAGKEAVNALMRGDVQLAFEEKQRQLINHELYREAVKAKEGAVKTVENMRRYNKEGLREILAKAGFDYLAQIDAILDRYDFHKAVSYKELDRRKSLLQWVQDRQAEGLPIDVPEDVLNEARRVHYKELTPNELKDVEKAAEQIEHLARLKFKLLKNLRTRNFEEAVGEIVSDIEANHTISKDPPDFAPGFKDKIIKGMKSFLASHTKMEFLFDFLSGNSPAGVIWQHLYKPFAQAEDAESKMIDNTTLKLREIFSVYPKEQRARWFLDKIYIPEIKNSLNKANILVVALNTGNAYNKEALLNGYGWDHNQLAAILNHMDGTDWKVVQQIWDHIDTYWPAVEALEKDLNGIAPEKVEATPVVNKYGEFRGGYYPIIFDKDLSWRQFKLDERASVQEAFGGNWSRAMTRHGHTIERVGAGGKPILLNLGGLTQHIHNVAHDLAFRPAVLDISRLINDERVREAIQGAAGKEMYRQLNPWLNAIASDRRSEPANAIEKLLGRARAGATMVNMGWKLTTAIVQFSGYSVSTNELGAKYALTGLKEVYSNPMSISQTFKSIAERSQMMKDRLGKFDRDVREAMNKLQINMGESGYLAYMESHTQEVRDSFLAIIGYMDMAVAMPTWMGAYHKAMDGFVDGISSGDEQAAIDYADKVVRQTQGLGSMKDLAQVQRGSEAFKLFTMFYSYFSMLFNQFQKTYQEFKSDHNVPKLVSSLFLTWFVPAVLDDFILGRVPDDEGDDEKLKYLIKKEVSYPFQSIILLRDIVNGMDRYGYEPSPAFTAFESMIKTAKISANLLAGDKEEITRADVRSAFDTIGYLGALPTKQVWNTGSYFYDWITGEYEPENAAKGIWEGLVVGKKKD